MRDELNVLSAFLAVADERSFTKAAKRLNISTSGLSQAIRRLEGTDWGAAADTHNAQCRVTQHLESGVLVRVLEDWCPPFPGFFLYYPSRRHQPAALSALIDTLRLENDRPN